MAAGPPERILVRGTNWIGDLVLISPALRLLRETWPGARISLLVRERLADAMRPNPNVDEVIPYDRGGRHRPPRGTLALARELKERRFDLAVLFPKSFESALIAKMAGIPVRAGWRTDLRGPLITHGERLGPADRGRHHLWQFLEVARFAGCPRPAEPQVAFHLEPGDGRAAGDLLGAEGREAAFLLAVHPGASKPPRSWHGERFAAAADRVLEGRPGLLLLLGGPREREECARIAAAARGPSLDLSGRTSIRQMAALIERADLLLCNDSGPMHLASALGTPAVAVFGPGTPRLTAPLVGPDLCRTVTLDLPCSPCRQDYFRECRPGPWGKPYCLEDLPVSRVARAAERILETESP